MKRADDESLPLGDEEPEVDDGNPWSRLGWRARQTVNRAASPSYFASLLVASFLPMPLAFRVASCIGQARYEWQRQQRRPSLALGAIHLQQFLGKEPDEVEAILRRSFVLRALDHLHGWLDPRMTQATMGRYIRFQGIEHLEGALAKGRGAIVYSGHTKGCWTFFVSLGRLGHPMTVLKKGRNVRSGDPYDRWFYERELLQIEKVGFDYIFTEPPSPFTAQRGVSVLRRNRLVWNFADARSGRPGDVRVRFLKKTRDFAEGSALMAKLSGAPLIDVWVSRPNLNGPWVATFGPPLEVTGDHKEAVREQAARLERRVWEDPANWFNWITL